MSFWTATSDIKDPKRKFRFLVRFSNFGTDSTLWFAKTATKPSFQIASAEHKYLNHTFYYPGSVTWQDVAITLVDPTDPDVASTLSNVVTTAGYKPPDPGEYATISKGSSVTALGVVTIVQLAADGTTELEAWQLHNAWITEVKYGDLEYGGDDLTELSITLKYDWASMKPGGTDGSILASGETMGADGWFSI